ncbi:hypothetical protein V5O48_012835 [Marasmius crinis-equi]|uniref:Carboxylic ester hydrolase n=1 Tax=Marasmius crinis-equi TaxID=585013 RepID=A0ABR3F1R1_9AGAR
MKVRAALLNTLLLAGHSLFGAIASEAEVSLGETRVIGLRDERLDVDFFGGIPFAEPPVKDLRFRPPVLKTTLNSSEFDASKSGLACVQAGTPVIFVASNWRLGPLGFPMGEEAANSKVQNLGLHDNVAALQWVQANIEAFGGDPSRVTIFGESAGARNIDLLLFYEQINDLASGAIIESDAGTPLLPPSLDAPWQNFVSLVTPCSNFANKTGALDCLRSKNVSTSDFIQALIDAGFSIEGGSATWEPVLDGPDGLIPTYPSQTTVKAKFPVIIGNCLDEGTFMLSQSSQNKSGEDYIRDWVKSFPHREDELEKAQQTADRVLEAYLDIPALGSPFGSGNNTFGLWEGYKRAAAVVGDAIFQSHRRVLLGQLAQRPEGQAYSFIFAEDNDGVITIPSDFIFEPHAPGSLGVPHASEIFYVFGTLEDELGPGNVTANALEASRTVLDYWISFAVTGDPNDGKGSQRPQWTPYSPSGPTVIQLKGNDTRLIPDTFREDGISVFSQDPLFWRR